MPVSPNDRFREQRTPLLSGGCSQQPPEIRTPSQVGDSANANYSIVEGMTRRPGSWVQQHIPTPPGYTSLLPAGNNRLHAIIRDQTERYIVVHWRTGVGGGQIMALELSTNIWSTVEVKDNATHSVQAYLNFGNPDDFRFRSLIDYTLILNSDKPLAGTLKSGTISGTTATLKGSGTITAVTPGAATSCASAAHTLQTGDIVFIEGSTSIPTISGLWSVTRVDANTFTVPVNTTVGGGQCAWVKVCISTANPTVITSTAHGLNTGDTIIVTGSNSTPSIDGAQVVTVLTADTFTVPVNVNFPGTVGAWTIRKLDASTMPMSMVRQNTGGGTGTASASAGITVTCNNGVAHGLVTGQTIYITASTTAPPLTDQFNNGYATGFVVTVTSPTTFTINVASVWPLGVVSPGTITWVSRAYFTIDLTTWNDRPSGDETTNPLLDPWLKNLKASDLRDWRGRLWIFAGTHLTSSQSGDLFNFWIQNVNAIQDSDPIDQSLSSDRVTDINFAFPLQEALFLLTKAGRQFVVTTGGGTQGLTATSLQASPVTGYTTLQVEPAVINRNIYYCGQNGTSVQLLEYVWDDVAAPNAAEDVSQHVPTFVPLNADVPADIGVYLSQPSSIKKIETSVEHGMVFILPKDKVAEGVGGGVGGTVFTRRIFVYRTRYIGNQKVQSAWTRWEIAGVKGVHDLVVIGNFLYLLVHNGPTTGGFFEFFLVRIDVTTETDADDVPLPTDF